MLLIIYMSNGGIQIMFNFTSTDSNLLPEHMVWSPDQALVMTTTGLYGAGPIAKVTIRDGSDVYNHRGLFSPALLTSELFFYCKLKQMDISSVEQAVSYHFNWLELVI